MKLLMDSHSVAVINVAGSENPIQKLYYAQCITGFTLTLQPSFLRQSGTWLQGIRAKYRMWLQKALEQMSSSPWLWA